MHPTHFSAMLYPQMESLQHLGASGRDAYHSVQPRAVPAKFLRHARKVVPERARPLTMCMKIRWDHWNDVVKLAARVWRAARAQTSKRNCSLGSTPGRVINPQNAATHYASACPPPPRSITYAATIASSLSPCSIKNRLKTTGQPVASNHKPTSAVGYANSLHPSVLGVGKRQP